MDKETIKILADTIDKMVDTWWFDALEEDGKLLICTRGKQVYIDVRSYTIEYD